MEYTVGSLADLISGNKSANHPKVVQKTFIPIVKKEPQEKNTPIDSLKKDKSIKESNKTIQKNPRREFPDNKSNSLSKVNNNKKRKLVEDTSENASTDKPSPKLSRNRANAEGRIKNKLNQEIKNSVDYTDKTLFVGNIPLGIKKEKIKKHFRKYGEIDSVRIRGIPVADIKTTKKVAAITNKFHPDRNSALAYIRFMNAEDCKKAEAENGELFHDHHLRVHCCNSESKLEETKAIFVGNLSFKAEEDDLWDLFKCCGQISHVRIVRDGRTRIGKGFGYVNFKDADSVQLAIEMGKVMLKDRELRISPCDSNRAKKIKLKPRKNINGNSFSKGSGNEKLGYKNKEMRGKNKFSGTKFNDNKKKKKFNKATLEKKKLAKKLVAPKSQKN